ncbi:MAG: MATE family efflux transporter [Clostridia bacterium]|nr:MATE family efflux transporter [Clostridia bacterium]MDD4543716.1 MATE family efflux transporter [Clostridia bacterium]
MTTTPVPKLIITLAIPMILSMLVSAIYNLADTYFVSQLGTSASGAVGVVFSLMATIQAVGFMLGMGTGAQISRLLGQKKNSQANVVAINGLVSAIIFGILMLVLGLKYHEQILLILGSTETILPHAEAYAQYIFYAAPFMAGSFVLNNILRSQGKAKFAMIGIMTGAVLNIGLDPLFIFGFDMGIGGAALATAISQTIGFMVLLVPFFKKMTEVKLSFKFFSFKPIVLLRIMKNGLPSFIRQGFASAATVILNRQASLYGDSAIAAMSIVLRIVMFIFIIVIGFGQGYQPVVGYNYGAKIYERVKEAFVFSLKVGMLIMAFFAILGFIFAPGIMAVFLPEDAAVIEIGALAFRAQCIAMLFMPFSTLANMTFQSIGKSWTATFLSSLRQGIFFLPLIIFLPRFIGLAGVQFTQAISDVLTFLVCLPFVISFFVKLKKRDLYQPKDEIQLEIVEG